MGDVRVAEVSTDSVPNTSATAGSTGADLNAAAAIDACRVLLERLAPVREALGDGATMAQVAAEARARRIPLQTTGFHASDIGEETHMLLVSRIVNIIVVVPRTVIATYFRSHALFV